MSRSSDSKDDLDADVLEGRAYDARLARRLLGYVRPHRRLALVAVALTAVVAALHSAPPYLLGLAVDAGIGQGDLGALARIAALLLAIEVGAFFTLFAQEYVLTLAGQRIMRDLRLEVFDRVQRQSLAFLSRQPVGRLVTRVMNDVSAIADLFTTGVVAALGDLLAILFAGALLVRLDPRLAGVTFLALPLVGLVAFATRHRIRASFREIRRLLARLNATIAENASGMAVVQLFNREERNRAGFARQNLEHFHAQRALIHWQGMFSTGVTVLTLGAVAVLLGLGGEATLEGRLSVGVLVAFVGYAQRLFLPIRDIAEKYQIFQGAMASAERLFQLLDAPDEVADPAAPRALPRPVQGEIELRQVSFHYPSGRTAERVPALTDVSFRIAPGETVAIVGHTGAGKSTIINLLARFYDASEGAVLLDGVPVGSVPQRELRRALAVVLQEVFIFTGTVLDNIRLGSAISDERCIEAARAVGADAFVRALPGGYAHRMRERGATLSVGQKQLISFARALAHDPRVLVLDEATSSIDPETERRLQEAVTRLVEGRTAIVIAHRLATIRDADRVLVLHKGKLVEEGTLDDLLAKEGLFRTLYRLQYPEAAEPAPCGDGARAAEERGGERGGEGGAR